MTSNPKTILSSLLLLAVLSTYSQNTTLDPITITASLHPQAISTTGRNMTIINGEQFSKLPVHSIDDLLRYVPGVEVQQRGAMGSQSDIVLRGGTFQQVLVILDGLRLNDPNTGHFNAYIPIAPAEIDRIEILKGASSAIYGSEAVGGVIHIITKTFAAKKGASKKMAEAGIAAGEFGLINAHAGFYYQQSKTAIGGGLLTNNADGQPQRGTDGFFHNNTASLSLSHVFSDHWKLSLRSAYDKQRFSAQNFYTSFVSDTATEKVQSLWNQLELVHTQGSEEFRFSAGYKKAQDEYAYNSGVSPNSNKSELLQGLATWQHSISAQTRIITGAQYQQKTIRSNDRGNHHLDAVAGFVIWQQAIGKYVSVSPALRLDWNERRGTELVPQVNLSYRRNHWQLRASAGKTIRDADFTEGYNNYNKALVTSGSVGNPNLYAERSFSYEGGADYWAGKGFKISSTVFRRKQKGVIDWVVTPYSNMPRKDNLSPAGSYALATNIAAVNTTGAEADVQFSGALPNQQQLWATLGLTWLQSRSTGGVKSFYISSHAHFLANVTLQWSTPRLALSVNAIYKNREPQQASAINVEIDRNCFMMNSKIDLFFCNQRFALFAQVDNITDSGCRDILGSLRPGRWAMAGMRFRMAE